MDFKIGAQCDQGCLMVERGIFHFIMTLIKKNYKYHYFELEV